MFRNPDLIVEVSHPDVIKQVKMTMKSRNILVNLRPR